MDLCGICAENPSVFPSSTIPSDIRLRLRMRSELGTTDVLEVRILFCSIHGLQRYDNRFGRCKLFNTPVQDSVEKQESTSVSNISRVGSAPCTGLVAGTLVVDVILGKRFETPLG